MAPSEAHYFALKIFLPRWTIFEILHLNDRFRPMKTAIHSLICHWNEIFLNFPSFPSFRIGSIAQNENPKMVELFSFLKSLNWLCQFRSAWNILAVLGVSLKIFKMPMNFPKKHLLTFAAVQNILRDQRSKNFFEKMAPNTSRFS